MSCRLSLTIAVDSDTDVLANDQVFHVAQRGPLSMVPGMLDGNRCLPE